MITRYRLEYDDLDVYEDGNLVKYEDHQAEVAQLQARVAELDAALGGMYESFRPLAWGSDDNKRDALTDARKALGVE